MSLLFDGITSSFSSQTSSSWDENALSGNPEHTIRRVTIKQLLSAIEIQQEMGSLSLCIDQRPLGKFVLVANAYSNNIILSKCRVFYGFDDGTGRIKGYKTKSATGYPTFAPFDYVSVLGQLLKRDDGSFIVKTLHIRQVKDPHEIYFHILHVIFDTLRNERGNPRHGDWALSRANQEMGHMISGMQDLAFREYEDPLSTFSDRALSELEQDIISCIRDLKEYLDAHGDERSSNGIELRDIVQELKPSYPGVEPVEFWYAIERLLDKGILCTKFDDNHVDLA